MSQLHMPNSYSDEDWNDLTEEERRQSLAWAHRASYMDDEERDKVQEQIAELYETLNGETDYDVIRDIHLEINDLEEMLEAQQDADEEVDGQSKMSVMSAAKKARPSTACAPNAQ